MDIDRRCGCLLDRLDHTPKCGRNRKRPGLFRKPIPDSPTDGLLTIPSIISQKSGIHNNAWMSPFREASHLKDCIQETTISVVLETDSS